MPTASKRALIAVVVAMPIAMAAAGGAGANATLRASLSGKQEVSAGDADGRGSARITTFPGSGRVCFAIHLSKVGTVTQGHIHKARKGRDGNVVVILFSRAATQPKGCVRSVSKSLIRDIERHPSRYYVNVHNAQFPAGALRGQLHR